MGWGKGSLITQRSAWHEATGMAEYADTGEVTVQKDATIRI